MTYRLFVFSYLLLFSFFHVGFAAVEYLCSMGMEMEAPVCSSCHSNHEPVSGKVTVATKGTTPCCDVVVTKTETIDAYVNNQLKVHTFIENGISSGNTEYTPEEKPIVKFINSSTPVLPLFNLHGISTSIQYTSFLR